MRDGEERSGVLLPFVRHMLLCDDVRAVSGSRKVTVYGLTSTIRVGEKGFPATCGFSVYVQLTECRGEGAARIVIVEDESDQVCYQGQDHRMAFGNDPLAVHSAVIRIPQCEFPAPGLYWVEMWYRGVFLACEPLLVR